MVHSNALNESHIVLLATFFITEANFGQLALLAAEKSDVLKHELLYRQLYTFLPTDTENLSGFATFLIHLRTGFKDVSNLDETLEWAQVLDLKVEEAQDVLHELRLNGGKGILQIPTLDSEYENDYTAAFLIEWLRKVDDVSGLSITTKQLVDPLAAEIPEVRIWRDSYLLPLLRLQTEYYPGSVEYYTLRMLEELYGLSGVQALLRFAAQDGSDLLIGRDLENIISPWIRGTSQMKGTWIRKLMPNAKSASWQDVNEWIYSTSRDNYRLAATSFLEWDGPGTDPRALLDSSHVETASSMLSYIRTGLALIATSTETGGSINLLLKQLLDRAVSLSASAGGPWTAETPHRLARALMSDLLENAVLQPSNPITYPSDEVFLFLEHCLSAQKILEELKISLSTIALVEVALFGSKERQHQELLRILQQVPRLTRSEVGWPIVRKHLYTLRCGRDISNDAVNLDSYKYTFLGRVPSDDLERGVLNALILNEQYALINEVYLDSTDPPLAQHVIQEEVVSAIYTAYDNASNGNRTRGGMKRAYELLQAFKSRLRSAPVLTDIDHLIRATHSLSFYQITLQHGVPYQPAMIRVMENPLSLIEKVLSQNYKAFTKLDDLLDIGYDLIKANLTNSVSSDESPKTEAEQVFDARHHITYLAITYALLDHDFDTAYSYTTTRLATTPSQVSKSPFTDDTSWKAAYAAGRYRPLSSPKSLHGRITALSKRMDLLSLALILTPNPESLSEILATWRRCEEEMDSLKSQAIEEERSTERQSFQNRTVPGNFGGDEDTDAVETRRMMERRAIGASGPTYQEEVPMGLFDVARGAATAFRRSAFPLHRLGGPNNDDNKTKDDNDQKDSPDERLDNPNRVRKRDVVSNMVTGGLVSGMSWVLGTQPAKEDAEG